MLIFSLQVAAGIVREVRGSIPPACSTHSSSGGGAAPPRDGTHFPRV